MKFDIRKIQMEDVERFHSALSSIAQEQKFNFIKENIAGNYAHYVALHNGHIVGWADIIPSMRQSMGHVGSLGMGIIKEYRGKGIGTDLLTIVINHAWNQGLKRLELEVFAKNEVAINLYKKFGYSIEGVKKYAHYLDGKFQDILVMAQYRL